MRLVVGLPLPASASSHLSTVSLRCSLLDAGRNQISMSDDLRAHLSSHLCSVSLLFSLLDAEGNQISMNDDDLRTYLRGEGIRALRREFSTALATLHVLG
jgi:hypothetical protein